MFDTGSDPRDPAAIKRLAEAKERDQAFADERKNHRPRGCHCEDLGPAQDAEIRWLKSGLETGRAYAHLQYKVTLNSGRLCGWGRAQAQAGLDRLKEVSCPHCGRDIRSVLR